MSKRGPVYELMPLNETPGLEDWKPGPCYKAPCPEPATFLLAVGATKRCGRGAVSCIAHAAEFAERHGLTMPVAGEDASGPQV